MGRKLRETSGRRKNSIETDEEGHRKARGSRGSALKPAPQRRALPKAKAGAKRRQHSGGEPSRRSLKELETGHLSKAGRTRDDSYPNNIGADGKGSAESRRQRLRKNKLSKGRGAVRR